MGSQGTEGPEGSAVATMVSHLDLAPGMRVLEVTAGATHPSAELHDHVHPGSVDVIPVDHLSAGHLSAPDLGPPERAGGGSPTDPALPGCTDYDRVLVSVPLAVVPYALVESVRNGGTLLVPWANPLAGPSLARLTVEDERAYGRFVTPLPAMGEQADARAGDRASDRRGAHSGDHRGAHSGDATAGDTNVFDIHADTLLSGAPASCGLDPDALWSDRDALFALGMQLPDLRFTQAEFPDGSGRIMRWVYDQEAWAGVSVSADGRDPHWEHYGLSTLWGMVEKAYRWWVDSDRPSPDQFGMTVASYGQFGWLRDRYSGRMWRL
ncbi:hypothetical protein [Actinopolymorpha sp. B9G3]|uniref:hypothetical protein n=1 Tax=Actinopolymorpha sp. B9G3 TaxID=3158970 RepID=UPI0032D8C47F